MSIANELNADFSQRAVMRTAEMDWQASPSATVWRKRLDLKGPKEAGRVTSIVRYDPESRFPPHEHPGGEEILVLEGTFSDEHGDYPAGTYLLNPEGFSHAPHSKDGCVLFVKLRQYPGSDRTHVVVNTNTAAWQSTDTPGWDTMPLYDAPDQTIRLTRLGAGVAVPQHAHPAGEELLILEGVLEDENGRYKAGDWVRYPPGSSHQGRSPDGCVVYVKSGHLAA